MNTKIYKIAQIDEKSRAELRECANVISRGGLVVFPTETVYGLGADATDEAAVKSIYEAKGRPSDNPLIIHIANPSDAEKYAYTTELYYNLANRFMPGPLTVVLKAKDTVPMRTRGGLDTVAVRCPENEIARELISLSGTAIAAPSANLSGTPSPTDASHVISDMTGRVDVIIDGGASEFGLESTIVKIEDDQSLTLLRPGKITVDELIEVSDVVKIAGSVTEELHEGEVALSPGMKYRHYAPKSPLVLYEGTKEELSAKALSSNERLAVIAYTEDIPYLKARHEGVTYYDFGKKEDELSHAKRLFSLLRATDGQNFDKIYAPLPDTHGVGLALYNRMIRAAAHTIIRLKDGI